MGMADVKKSEESRALDHDISVEDLKQFEELVYEKGYTKGQARRIIERNNKNKKDDRRP